MAKKQAKINGKIRIDSHFLKTAKRRQREGNVGLTCARSLWCNQKPLFITSKYLFDVVATKLPRKNQNILNAMPFNIKCRYQSNKLSPVTCEYCTKQTSIVGGRLYGKRTVLLASESFIADPNKYSIV